MTLSLQCKKCLTSRTGDVLGEPCRTPGCDGLIEKQPEWSELVDRLPEPMTCGRRFDMYSGGIPVHYFDREGKKDYWERFKTNGNRVCSYCGSLHPEDFLALVKQCANEQEDATYQSSIRIEPSDKSYKIYVHQPGVRNAHEGGIKFYTQHLPRDEQGKLTITEDMEDEYHRAIVATNHRFEIYLKGIKEARAI